MARSRKQPDTTNPAIEMIPIADLVPHPLNANLMPAELREKLAENIRRTRRYPPVIARRLADGSLQIIDGEHRWSVLKDLGEQSVACVIWNLDDHEALLLLATLNRLHGEDVPARRAALVAELQQHETLAALAALLPESEAELHSTLALADFDVEALVRDLEEASRRAAEQGPQLFSFAVDPEDAPRVQEALDRASADLTGKNRRGRALVYLAQEYLGGGD